MEESSKPLVIQLKNKDIDMDLHYFYAVNFVKLCAKEFQWKDLSKDVIMDVGCGESLHCCKAILKEFPDVKAFVAIDNEQGLLWRNMPRDERIHLYFADIVKRDTLTDFQGKMNKVFSTNVFHLISDKLLAFHNVYDMLRPGGEAAFLFYVDSCFHHFIKGLLEIPRFQAAHIGVYDEDRYSEERRGQYYKQMLEKVGFRDVRFRESPMVMCFSSEEECKNHLYGFYSLRFCIPPEDAEEFREEFFQLYMQKMGAHEGKPFFKVLLLNLLGVKPL